jgi:hypothetical protein
MTRGNTQASKATIPQPPPRPGGNDGTSTPIPSALKLDANLGAAPVAALGVVPESRQDRDVCD